MSTDSSLSFLSKLKNKALYQVEKLVNDPEANQYMKEREPSQKGEKPVKEAMEDTPTESGVDAEATSDSPVIRVLQKMLYYTKRIIRVAFYPFISLILSSLVANEMIVYPAPIRFVFFIFTLVLCIISRVILMFISIFYLCKWGFHYYVNHMSDGPKRIIMPSLFALLPLTTKEYSNTFLNLLARPFQYGEKWSVKDGEELLERMNLYQEALNESFPYVERIRTTDPFMSQLKKIETRFEKLHQAMAPEAKETAPLPATISPSSATAATTATATAPLPATV